MKKFEHNRQSRSEKYQWKIIETNCSNDILALYSNKSSLQSQLNPWFYNEKLLDLQEELLNRIIYVINNQLTQRQKEVFNLTVMLL